MGNKSGREREALRREEEARLEREKETGNKPGISQRILSDEEQFDVGEKFIRDKGCWEPYMRAVKCISVTNDWAQCPDETRELHFCLAGSYIKNPTPNNT